MGKILVFILGGLFVGTLMLINKTDDHQIAVITEASLFGIWFLFEILISFRTFWIGRFDYKLKKQQYKETKTKEKNTKK